MITGTRSKRVTFNRPFALKGLKEAQPSGTYSVETREEPAAFFSFLEAKRTSTWIRVCRQPGIAGVLQMVSIDPFDLTATLLRDAAPTE